MFERYTEKARRVIFFARYEASQFGSPYIETEHMLLGILREDKRLTNRFLRSHASVESIRKQIEARTTIREKVSTSVDLPISNEGKRVLTFAAEEAERLSHPHIGTEHLLLGLMREEKCFAAELLKERGVQLDTLREQFAQLAPELATPVATAPGQVTGLFQDLSRAATDGLLEPVIARSLELDCVFEILSRRDRKNPILIGTRIHRNEQPELETRAYFRLAHYPPAILFLDHPEHRARSSFQRVFGGRPFCHERTARLVR